MFRRRRSRLPELGDIRLPDLSDVRLRDVRLPDLSDVRLPDVRLPDLSDMRLRDVRLPDVSLADVRKSVGDIRLPEVQLPDLRLSDVHLPEVRLPDVQLPQVPDVRVPSLAVAGLRTPELDIGGRAPFVRRHRSNPVWTGLKFSAGLVLGLVVGCLIAALVAPAAGEDLRQMLAQRVRRGDPPPLPDASAASSGAVTRGRRVSSAANVGPLAEVRSRFGAARAAMDEERLARENALWARFRRALQTGRAAEV